MQTSSGFKTRALKTTLWICVVLLILGGLVWFWLQDRISSQEEDMARESVQQQINLWLQELKYSADIDPELNQWCSQEKIIIAKLAVDTPAARERAKDRVKMSRFGFDRQVMAVFLEGVQAEIKKCIFLCEPEQEDALLTDIALLDVRFKEAVKIPDFYKVHKDMGIAIEKNELFYRYVVYWEGKYCIRSANNLMRWKKSSDKTWKTEAKAIQTSLRAIVEPEGKIKKAQSLEELSELHRAIVECADDIRRLYRMKTPMNANHLVFSLITVQKEQCDSCGEKHPSGRHSK